MFNTEQVRIILPNLKWFCRSTGNYLRRGNFLVHFDLVIISSVHLSFYYFEKSRKIGHLHYIITSVDLQVSALLSLKSEGMSWWLVTPVPAPGLAALSWRPLPPVVIMGCLQAGWPQLPPAPPQPFNTQWLMILCLRYAPSMLFNLCWSSSPCMTTALSPVSILYYTEITWSIVPRLMKFTCCLGRVVLVRH